jgi:hypothetical protein
MAIESHFRLRIPADLKAKIEEMARVSGRSLNAQVLFSLEMALGQQDEISELKARCDEHEGSIKELEKDVSRLLEYAGLMYDRR